MAVAPPHAEIARLLLDAELCGTPVEPLSSTYPGLTLEAAYAIQLAGRELRLARGARVVGRKVGLTSAAIQEQLGVLEPDFGYLTDTMVHASGAVVPIGRCLAPKVEAEILFRVRGLPASPSVEDVLAATVEIAPALEVIDSRIRDWRIAITDTVADNASSAAVVVGAFRPLDGLDLRAVEMVLTVEDGGRTEQAEGRGDAVLGHPARAVAWLADALRRHGGEEIGDGELILPGAMGRALPVTPAATASASFAGLGEVSARFG